ncbi:hypothetical protein SAMN04489761_0277 [Tenacibaculum sp. MAR_2009_124]|uniref:hypothetical protein n=1 Tax=Tenacibaculum sp. MAR_2009_124 TaxID=1250059 RepID=UPI00089D0BB3|nr:hypothetical protein [Tenacibaculum sp. MAR_2009_124]SEB37720.1 hypothetical protein SAMN04489761_0277 [Tenacibaculum sp. MAR_2009_124]
MKNLISIITPVIDQMQESHLKSQLLRYFPLQTNEFTTIENSFKSLTSKKQSKEILNLFFKSWSQTNNSAMTVAGLSNRMTMLVHKNKPVVSEHDLFKAVASLNRIVDEDLAVVGRVLHSELFYTMATNIAGDDSWLSKQYLSKEAKAFKAWKDKNSLRDKDIMIGLLTTLVHEIYTHGEVEYIIPKFNTWLEAEGTYTDDEIATSLAWIQVHCGATEKDHFFHAVDAVNSYAKAQNIDVTTYNIEEIITTYLQLKSEVMGVLDIQIAKADELAFQA